ncbi:MAG TPA: adenylyltransferase/cytidyltransferase family protein [Bacteroidales bacterium]|nr:adenylyltransferase/cytidyltransferase family protein [Bacteroidales bacterium]
MKLYTDFDQCGLIRNAVVTTGTFDGVHIGHKAILQRLKKLALETGGETVVITFEPHPRKVLYPDTYGKDLYLIHSLREKIRLLEKAGLDHLIVVRFTREFSMISSTDFIREILLKKLHARKIVIGYNHHFGHNREGDFEKLKAMGMEFGFDVEEIPEQEIQHESVSGTRIREALEAGDIRKANRYLDHHYLILGEPVLSRKPLAGTGISGYRVLIEEESKLIPPDGVYAVSAVDGEHCLKAVCHIRKEGGTSIDAVVEFFVPDPVAEFPANPVTLLFHDRLGLLREEPGAEGFRKQLVSELEMLNQVKF